MIKLLDWLCGKQSLLATFIVIILAGIAIAALNIGDERFFFFCSSAMAGVLLYQLCDLLVELVRQYNNRKANDKAGADNAAT